MNVEERIVYVDDLEAPIEFTAKSGKNRFVIVLQPPPYLFSC